MRYNVHLDGQLVTTSPDGMKEERVRALVDEAIVELRISGVVTVSAYVVPVPVPHKTRSLNCQCEGVRSS